MRRRKIGTGVLALWFVATAVLFAVLLSKHLVTLPAPASEPGSLLAASLRSLRTPEEQGQWQAVHVLSAGCRCSQQVAVHLAQRPRPLGWAEVVLWVDDTDAKAELPAGLAEHFRVIRLTPAELAHQGIESAPLLIALSPAGEVRYAGGYTDRKQGPAFHDLEILASVQSSVPRAALPVFGCAVSERLKKTLTLGPAI